MLLFLIKRKQHRKNCAICHKKAVEPRGYLNDRGEHIVVCRQCVEYAERRAFRKV